MIISNNKTVQRDFFVVLDSLVNIQKITLHLTSFSRNYLNSNSPGTNLKQIEQNKKNLNDQRWGFRESGEERIRIHSQEGKDLSVVSTAKTLITFVRPDLGIRVRDSRFHGVIV